MGNDNRVIVAIYSIVYNHADFIRDCLEGFVMQKTNFRFVAIVHDDASTDQTAEIIREYAERYPELIQPIFEKENQYSKCDGSLARIMNKAMVESGADYIAMCEGDDYWTDPYKLQKQVDFMEENKQYSACFHNARVLDENNHISLFNSLEESYIQPSESIIKRHWFIPTASLMYRNFVAEYPDVMKNEIRDYAIELYYASRGPFYYMDDVMSVYRLHQDSASKDIAKNQIKMHDDMIALYKKMRPLFDEKYSDAFDYAIDRFEKGKAREIRRQRYPWLKFFKRSFYKRKLLNWLGA